MAGRMIRVDTEALTSAAGQVDSVTQGLELSDLSPSPSASLMEAATGLAGTECAGVLPDLAQNCSSMLAGLVAGLEGLAQGLRVAAEQTYARRLFISTLDSRPAADAVLAELASQGWTINRGGPGNGVDSSESVAVKDGASITVSAGVSDNGGMVLLGGTACVAADGTIDERNPS